jgi:hypothetical protein
MLSWILVSWRKGLLAGWCDPAPIEEIFLCRSEGNHVQKNYLKVGNLFHLTSIYF